MGDKFKELLEIINVFGEKSASADKLTRSDVVGIYEGAMGELEKSQSELGKLLGAGVSGWWLSVSGWLPEVVSLCVGIATLLYLIIKIYKELK